MRARTIGFQRGGDAKKAMGIGIVGKRVFDDIDEVVEWALEYPQAFSGELSHQLDRDRETGRRIPGWNEWTKDHIEKKTHSNKTGFSYDSYHFNSKFIGKLAFVKWLKWNIRFNPYPESTIGLKDSKMIADKIEERLVDKFYPENKVEWR